MKVIIREYTGAEGTKLFDLLDKNKPEVESEMKEVKGLISYTLARTDDGGYSVTVCSDQSGIDDSTTRAKNWISKNAPDITAKPARTLTGEVITNVQTSGKSAAAG